MGRPKKILSQEEQSKLDQKLKVRAFILRILSHVEPRKINWIINSSIAKSLYKNYPADFLDTFILPDFLHNIEDLRPLTGNWGKQYINDKANLWKFNNEIVKQDIELSAEKVGPDVQISSKPKNLLDFLK